jgi:hypothetical protein
MSSLLVGGGAVVLRRDLGSSGAVQGFRTGQTAVYGAKLSTGVSGIVLMQAGGAAAQLLYATGFIYNVDVLEALAVLDGFASSAIFSAIATDGIVAADPFGGQTTATRTTLDSVTGFDSLNRNVTFNLSRSEFVASSESFDADISAPGIVNGTLAESVSAADAIAVNWVSNASVTGSITASDTGSRYTVTSAAVSAGVTAGHTFDGYLSTGIVFDVTTFDSVFATDELTVEYFSGEDNNLKLSLAPILSLYRSAERLNSNFEAIQEAFQNTLSRDGSEPNNMLDDMDMDSHRITNLGAPVDDNDAVRLIDLTTYAGGGGGGGTVTLPTDLTLTRTPTTATVASSTGADATIPAADTTNAGVMTAADKTKLNSIQAGATDDQTGAEIVDAINTFLGSITWQGGGGTGGSTNLSFSRTATSVTVLSDTGTDAVLPVADSTNAGVMSAADKVKLDGITGGGGGATNLTFSRTVDSVTVLSDTGTDAVLPEATNTLAGVFSGTNKAKLDGIETDATSNEVNFVRRFGGVGDGVTSNNAAIALAEASAFENIYLPEGNFVSSVSRETLTKKYIGPGKLIYNSGQKGVQNINTYVTEVSANANSGEYGTNEKMTFSDFDYRIIAPGTRRNFERYLSTSGNPAGYPKYYWAPAIPKFAVFKNRGGWSGTSGILASSVSVGATTAVLQGDVNNWSTAGLIGLQVGFVSASSFDGSPTDTVTVTAASGSTITFTPALANAYPAGTIVSHGYRTMNVHDMKVVEHTGGGDAYAYLARITVANQPLNSQRDTFHVATGGIIGGDMTLGAHGNYGTGWECAYWDNGFDGAFIASVNSYVRTNNTSDRQNAVWIHDLPKMDGGGNFYETYGLKPLDGVYAVAVAARTGLDLTRSRFSVAAIALPLGERIGFDATTPTVPGSSNGWGYVADSVNNMFMRGGSDGGGKFIQLRNQDNYIYMRPTSNQFTANTDFGIYAVSMGRLNIWNAAASSIVGSIYAGSDGSGDFLDIYQGSTYRMRLRASNGTLNFNGNINAAGDMVAGLAMRAAGGFYINTNVYIYWDGTNLRATKNGGASSVVIV